MYSLPPSLRVALFAYSLAVYAVPVQIPSPPSMGPASPTWSTEAILTLVGVIIAVTGLLITLVLSLPALRQRLCFSFGYCVSESQRGSVRSLQQEVEEWMEFKEWKELSKSRNASW